VGYAKANAKAKKSFRISSAFEEKIYQSQEAFYNQRGRLPENLPKPTRLAGGGSLLS
jgi:hypothetical protein